MSLRPKDKLVVGFHLDGSTQLRAKGYRSPFGRLYT